MEKMWLNNDGNDPLIFKCSYLRFHSCPVEVVLHLHGTDRSCYISEDCGAACWHVTHLQDEGGQLKRRRQRSSDMKG